MPSKYNNPRYPKELVRSVSLNLSLIAKQKVNTINEEDDDDEDSHMNRQQTQKNKNMKDDFWEIVWVIPAAEEKQHCHTENCDKDDAFPWTSNSNRNDIRNFCEGCQVIERGGRPNGVVPIKYSAEVEAAATTTGDEEGHPEAAAPPETSIEITPGAIRHNQPMHHNRSTLAILKQEMSDLNFLYSKNKPKEGRWALSTAAKNIDSWVKDTSGGHRKK